jgi:hypothetical protein
MSFQSLREQMPHLVSINYHSTKAYHSCSNSSLKIIDDDDLSNVDTLNFKLDCWNSQCSYYNQFSHLVGRMPNLKILVMLHSTLCHIRHPLENFIYTVVKLQLLIS